MKQLKLKPEYIIPYLPYKLKAYMTDYKIDYVGKKYDEIIGVHQWDKNGEYWSVLTKGGSRPNVSDIRPVLKPLDHIDKEEFDKLGLLELEELGVDYIGGGIVYMVNKYGLDLDGEAHFFGTDNHLPTIPWDIMQVFLKNHYDVFGLIEQGLAYDYNELNR